MLRKITLTLGLVLFSFLVKSQIIITLAGTGTAGYSGDGGPGTKASLSNPRGIALDSNGNIVIADMDNNVIRKLDTKTGIITRIAGQGYVYANTDGLTALNAGFNGPVGVAVDSKNNIYVVEEYAAVVRKIDAATNVISTVAGIRNLDGSYPYNANGAPAVSTRLSYPTGVAFDKNDNLYIADWDNSIIREVDATTQLIKTVAGVLNNRLFWRDGVAATNAPLNEPPRVFIDKSGNIYIPDQLNDRIRKVDAKTNIITTIAGNGLESYAGDGGLAVNAELRKPAAVTVDSKGNIFIADTYNNVIRKVDAVSGIITTIAGTGTAGYSGDNGNAQLAKLNYPTDIFVDKDDNLVIADAKNHAIRKIIFCNSTDGKIANDTTLCLNAALSLLGSDFQQSIWESSDNDVVSVKTDGNVLALKDGVARVSHHFSKNSCPLTDTMIITVPKLMTPFLGNDTTICSSDKLQLDAGNGFKNYEWNTGDIDQSIAATKPGKYIVKVTDWYGCFTNANITITNFDKQHIFPQINIVCENAPVLLEVPDNIKAIVWQDNSTVREYNINRAGQYSAKITDQHNCISFDTLVVKEFIKRPELFKQKEITICQYDTLSLATSTTYESYEWNTGATESSIFANTSGLYRLRVTDKYKCVWQDEVNVIKNDNCRLNIYFPTAFSPNNDGKNDEFKPTVYGTVSQYHLVIYNRWGNKVFETNDYNKGWTGFWNNQKQPDGVYIWSASILFPGKSIQKLSGSLVLMP
jgi:gliding motility-associated-like protein